MKDLKLDEIQLVLANPHSGVRNGLRMALNETGIPNNNIMDGGEIDVLSESLQGKLGPDVIICDTSLRGGDVLRMLQAIRHSDFGPNPFLGIIAMGGDTSIDAIRSVMDTGADLFLASPVSPKQVMDRLNWLVHNRKRFVVTTDYVGPDRRRTPRENEDPSQFIEAPNTLRYKAIGRWDPDYVALEIQAAVGILNDKKMQRHAFKLAQSAEEFALTHQAMNGESLDTAKIKELNHTVAELKKHAVSIGLDPVARLCAAAQSIINRLPTQNPGIRLRDTEILQQLTFAIRAAVNPDDRKTLIAHDIADVVAASGN